MLERTQDGLRRENIELAATIKEFAKEGRKLTGALELKLERLYARNDTLEALLRENGIEVPDWPGAEEGGV